MSKPITEIDDPRLVKALAHPLRVRIIGILERGISSPKRMSQELGIPIENLAYHVRLLRQMGLIKLDSTKQVRGTVEHFYRVVGRPKITNEAWANLPEIVREALDAATISQIFDTTTQAAAQGKLERPESFIGRHCYRVDEQGFRELSAAMMETYQRFVEIEKRAEARLRRHDDEVSAVCIGMVFDAPLAEYDPDAPAPRSVLRTPLEAVSS